MSVCPVCLLTLVYCGQTVRLIRIPLDTEVGFGPGDIVIDGDPGSSSPPTEKGTVRLCCFRHVSTSGFRIRASRASFIALLQFLAQILHFVLNVKRRLLTLFPVFDETGSSF